MNERYAAMPNQKVFGEKQHTRLQPYGALVSSNFFQPTPLRVKKHQSRTNHQTAKRAVKTAARQHEQSELRRLAEEVTDAGAH